jgi:type I restriction enzyme S subunit
VPLGDVADFVRGVTFKPVDVVDLGTTGSIACLRTANVQTELDLTDVWAIPSSFARRDEQHLRTGDIIVSSANSWNLVGKCSWVDHLPWPTTFGGFVSTLRARPDRVDARYLYRWFSAPRTQRVLRSFGRQTTNISNLNLDRCRSMPLPLPPIEEQRRIAAILDKADDVRAKRQVALGRLDALTEAIFIDLFGDPRKWSPPGETPRPAETTLGRVAVIGTGKLDANAADSNGQYPFFTCSRETLRINTPAFDGKAVLVAGNGDLNVKYWEGKFNAYQRTYVIQSRDEANVHPRFLHGFLDIYVARLREQAIGGVIKYIKLPYLTEAVVRLPSFENQMKFVECSEAIEDLRAKCVRSDRVFDNCFISLQHRAFRGEL